MYVEASRPYISDVSCEVEGKHAGLVVSSYASSSPPANKGKPGEHRVALTGASRNPDNASGLPLVHLDCLEAPSCPRGYSYNKTTLY